jgi:D-glycero-alpha-D-manno-heptose-7-phosphate kinase
MIISQTPLRISFLGGGTDFREFYNEHGGAVLTLAIDKFIYVILKERFDEDIYINYSKKEIVKDVREIKHDLVRETMKKTGIERGIEITTLSDIPSSGSGLGSSSSVTVGLLNAMYTYHGYQVTNKRLADEACEIEIDTLKKPIGIQDQYIAAFGNLCFIKFDKEGVSIEQIPLSMEKRNEFLNNFQLFYTNRTRKSENILKEQRDNIELKIKELCALRDLAHQGREALMHGDFDQIGHLLHEGWEIKKKLASTISDEQLESMYQTARNAGALGGKVLGAGGGGFLLIYCKPKNQGSLRRALKKYRIMKFGLSGKGSSIVFNIQS